MPDTPPNNGAAPGSRSLIRSLRAANNPGQRLRELLREDETPAMPAVESAPPVIAPEAAALEAALAPPDAPILSVPTPLMEPDAPATADAVPAPPPPPARPAEETPILCVILDGQRLPPVALTEGAPSAVELQTRYNGYIVRSEWRLIGQRRAFIVTMKRRRRR